MVEKKTNKKMIFFNNSPIDDEKNDIFDFSIKAQAIKEAIDSKANMIALIGDYGTGKSSLTKILYKNNEKEFAKPIFINLWDCISTSSKKEENLDTNNSSVSIFTKSFLYQLALGNTPYNHFSRYINQRLSKNYGKLSVALAKKSALGFFLAIGFCVSLFFICNDASFPDCTNQKWFYNFLSVIKSIRYLFLFLAGIFGYNSLKNNNILFSLWDSQGKIEPSDTDCFELFEEIISKIRKRNKDKSIIDKKNKKNLKQLIIIEDLDRSNNAPAVLALLKEIYRFNNLLTDENREDIIFIVSLKSENSLLEGSVEIEADKQKALQIYSKIFDYTVWIRPIHFANAKEIVLSLLKKQMSDEEASAVINDLYWIMQGDNLTVREIKDRLNESYLLYQSLLSRSIESNLNVSLKKCACVVYLQRQFPEEFQKLTSEETLFSLFMEDFTFIFNGDVSKIKEDNLKFVTEGNSAFFSDFKHMLNDRDIENDYRMYFYNYPADSYIMTAREKDVYNYITFDRTNLNQEELDKAIAISINEYNGKVIDLALSEKENAMTFLKESIFQNPLLFKYASENKQKFTFNSFNDYFSKKMLAGSYEDFCNLLKNNFFDNNNNSQYKQRLIESAVKNILNEYLRNNDTTFISYARSFILHNINENDIHLFSALFFDNKISLPIIDEQSVDRITTPQALFSCLNFKLINKDNCDIYFEKILDINFSEKDDVNELFSKINMIPNLSLFSEVWIFLKKIILKTKGWNSKLFLIIYNGYISQPEEIISLVQSSDLSQLSLDDLKKIDDLHTNIISDIELISLLEKNELFISALYSRIKLHNYKHYDFNSKQFYNSIKNTAAAINKKSPTSFIELRKLLIINSNLENENIYKLFNAPYPFVSENELLQVKSPESLYWLSDFSRIDLNNCFIYSSYCNSKNLSGKKLFYFFESLFLLEDNKISDVNIVLKILENIDFNTIKINSMSIKDIEHIINVFNLILDFSKAENSLNFLKIVNTHIDMLDLLIQEKAEMDNTIMQQYIDLCKIINPISLNALDFINKNKFETDYPDFITDELKNRNALYLYIIGKSLYYKKAFYDTDVDISVYLDCYKNNDEYFELVKFNDSLLELIYNNINSFSDLDLNRLLIFSKFPQKSNIMRAVLLKCTSDQEKRNYLMNISKIATYRDSSDFCNFITMKKFSTLFENDRELFLHVLNMLWLHDEKYKAKDLHLSFTIKMAKRYGIKYK